MYMLLHDPSVCVHVRSSDGVVCVIYRMTLLPLFLSCVFPCHPHIRCFVCTQEERVELDRKLCVLDLTQILIIDLAYLRLLFIQLQLELSMFLLTCGPAMRVKYVFTQVLHHFRCFVRILLFCIPRRKNVLISD